jgi:hypothetical protein
MRYLLPLLLLAGCAAKADDKSAAPKESYTAAVQRFEAAVAANTATLGNTNADLEAIDQRLKSVEMGVKEIKSLLSVDSELSVNVPAPPAEPPPVKADAPPNDVDRRTVTVNGKQLDVAATIKANYRRMWSFPGSLDAHLVEHGVKGAEGLDYETKRQLHSALHEMGLSTSVVTKERTVIKLPMSSQSCPNGHCPNLQSYGFQSNNRVFWRR